MIQGIAIVGGNGAGKSILGKSLAEALNYKFMDAEDYYFEDLSYSVSRSSEEVKVLMLNDIKKYKNFIVASVNGDYGEHINKYYKCIFYIQAPLDIRLERVKKRSFKKFGKRIQKGGDLFEQEENFFDFVATRTMEKTDKWVRCCNCPIIYINGLLPVSENVKKMVLEYQDIIGKE